MKSFRTAAAVSAVAFVALTSSAAFAFNTPADPLRSVDCVKQRCALIDKNLEYLKSIGE